MNNAAVIPFQSVVEVRTSNGGRLSGALLGSLIHPGDTGRKAYTRQVGELGVDSVLGRVRIDDGHVVHEIDGYRVTSLQAVSA